MPHVPWLAWGFAVRAPPCMPNGRRYAEREACGDALARMGALAQIAHAASLTRIARSLQPYSTLRQIYCHPQVPYRFRCLARVIYASHLHPRHFTAFLPPRPRPASSAAPSAPPAPPLGSLPFTNGRTRADERDVGAVHGRMDGSGWGNGGDGREGANVQVGGETVGVKRKRQGRKSRGDVDSCRGKGSSAGQEGGVTQEAGGDGAVARGGERRWAAGLVLVLEDCTGRLLVRLAAHHAEKGTGEVWEGEVWEGEVWEGEVWEGEVWEGEVWEGEVWEGDGGRQREASREETATPAASRGRHREQQR
ncbi:unnamed protein product [Closterium sp. Yama58-4]|nr:unnamed protein product [Closterium sp. Yama58-4]